MSQNPQRRSINPVNFLGVNEQRWNEIGRLERYFIQNPSEETAVILRDLWDNWITKGRWSIQK